ncbi:MAG: hypothetical protein R3C01_02445 [Planctomycetaceae bacterium]
MNIVAHWKFKRSSSSLVLVVCLSLGVPGFVAAETPATAANKDRMPTTFEKSPITISKETTVIDGPVRPDGYIDYVAALNSQLSAGVTPENNAAVLLLQVTGPREIPETGLARYCARLGIPTIPAKGNYLTHLAYVGENADPQEVDRLQKMEREMHDRPWTREEFPEGGRWLQENQKSYELALLMTKKTRYYAPLFTTWNDETGNDTGPVAGMLLPQAQTSRSVARLLAAHCFNEIAEGDLDTAWSDTQAMRRQARLIGQGCTLIDGLVGIAIDSMAANCERSVINSPRLTREQAARYLESLQAWNPVCDIAGKVDVGERYMYCDSIGYLFRGGDDFFEMMGVGAGNNRLEKALFRAGMLGVDADEVLKVGNGWYDRMVAALRTVDPEGRRVALKALDVEFRALKEKTTGTRGAITALVGDKTERGGLMGNVLVALMLPAVSAVNNAVDRSAATLDISRLGMAVRLYHFDHGQCPESLSALVPKYIAEVPRDPHGVGEMHYVTEANTATIYSFGNDGIDNKGIGPNSSDSERQQSTGDDISGTFTFPAPR